MYRIRADLHHTFTIAPPEAATMTTTLCRGKYNTYDGIISDFYGPP
jgi:hypothetical protein